MGKYVEPTVTDGSKGNQICMHDKESKIRRQMERGAKTEANSMTSLELVCVSVHVVKVDVSALKRVLGGREGWEQNGDVL